MGKCYSYNRSTARKTENQITAQLSSENNFNTCYCKDKYHSENFHNKESENFWKFNKMNLEDNEYIISELGIYLFERVLLLIILKTYLNL